MKYTLTELKARVTIDQLLARYNNPPLKRSGRRRSGPCPMCRRDNPRSRAFSVSADGRLWFCFGSCQRGGTVVDLVMAHDRLSLHEAIVVLQSLT